MDDPGSLEDHILVCTLQGEVKSLRIQDILAVIPLHGGRHCQVSYRLHVGSHAYLRVVQVQESQQDFKRRCSGLLQALQDGDESAINRHFSPRIPGKEN